MRTSLKRFAEKALARPALLSALRKRRAQDVVILAYHNVVPTGQQPRGGDSSLHLRQEDFARQLDSLQRTHIVIPLTSIFDQAGSTAAPRVAITFDDAYEGALTVGVEELIRRDMPATIFVAPGLIGQQTWWDILAAQGSLSEKTRRYALETLRGDGELVRSWALRSEMLAQLSPFRIGDEAQVVAAASRPGITLGSHTWSHRNLCALTPTELEDELSRPLEWLTARWGNQRWPLSYPYGMFSRSVEQAALTVGYDTAFRVEGGAMHPDSRLSRHALPRLNIPAGVSIDGFRLRVAGISI